MITKVVKINGRMPEKRRIRIAANVIKNGGVVVFPTETVYGIGADALNVKACRRIFRVKGRPGDNPLIVHVSDMRMADKVGIFPGRYRKQVMSLWPGPITFVVKARPAISKAVTGKLDTVAVRMPANRVALELIRACGTPIAAPSANISKRPSSTKAEHALGYFDGKVDLIVDSGVSNKGIESTILDLTTFTLLRPGALPVEDITKAFGKMPAVHNAVTGIRNTEKALSPGMKYRHYSPSTPLFMLNCEVEKLNIIRQRFVFIGSAESCRKLRGGVIKMSLGRRSRLDVIARNLFDCLIRLDRLDADFAVIETFPEHGIGLAIMNRIRKASGNKYYLRKTSSKALASSGSISG